MSGRVRPTKPLARWRSTDFRDFARMCLNELEKQANSWISIADTVHLRTNITYLRTRRFLNETCLAVAEKTQDK